MDKKVNLMLIVGITFSVIPIYLYYPEKELPPNIQIDKVLNEFSHKSMWNAT